jgi:hydrogenase/urease accessory protein HupE
MTTLEVAVDQPRPEVGRLELFRRIFWLGVEHILSGYDHLLFLLALLIVAPRLWQTVKVVTAFTLAHSLTLALAWFDLLTIPTRLVESLIAFSIAYVALENILGRGLSRRWLVAGGFGLIHGLGFYTVLRELDLASGDTVTTLLAFNLGVETGQLAVVALLYGPLVWWARQAWYRRSARAGSAVILLVASWWMIERLFWF